MSSGWTGTLQLNLVTPDANLLAEDVTGSHPLQLMPLQHPLALNKVLVMYPIGDILIFPLSY